VASNGATYKVRTGIPIKVIRLKKDKFNDPVFSPLVEMGVVDEDSEVAKFRKRFGKMSLFEPQKKK